MRTSANHQIRQAPDRGVYDQETIYAIIDAAVMGTVAVSIEGMPVAIPMMVARMGDHIYLHGLRTSRLMQHLAAGHPVCITIAHLDGIVVSRSGMHCSANYRSVVIHGVGECVADAEKPQLLHDIVEAIIPRSRGDYREHLPKEIKSTALVRVALDQSAAKIRTGGPNDDPDDINLPYWAGVIPVQQVFGEPISAADLPAEIEVPDYAKHYQRG